MTSPSATLTDTDTASVKDASLAAPGATKAAFELRNRLREQGWTPLETSTDFRTQAAASEQAGHQRTIAYFPAFRALLGGPSGWSHPGRPEVPSEAAFVEAYQVEVEHGTGRWRPVD